MPEFETLELSELPAAVAESIASWRRIIANARPDLCRDLLRDAATDLFQTRRVSKTVHPDSYAVTSHAIADALGEMAAESGIDQDDAQLIFSEAERALVNQLARRANGHDRDQRLQAQDYGAQARTADRSPVRVVPPLNIGEWLSRDLPLPDFAMGDWLSTTTRALLIGPTGLGKTNYLLALALHVAAGADFLHWRGRRPCKVLYVDGEMSRRLLRSRIDDAVTRLGCRPQGFHALSHEDVEGFAPLNTPAGQAYIEWLIEQIGKPDLIVLDSIMCLLAGDMKEGEPWAQVMPWVRSLTRRCIGQIWAHHTGHDESRSYGDKTKEWQMDTVQHMAAIARDGSDVSFSLEFRKARERTPLTRADFQTARIDADR